MTGGRDGPGDAGQVKPLRVLVVDDSAMQRGMLVALLNSDPDIEVVGWAANGEEGVRAAARLKPDVITMDLRMPVMDGIEASRRVMQETPTPIVMVTASASREDQQMAVQAFQAGILAIVAKPEVTPGRQQLGQELLRTVKGMAQVKVVRRWAPERLRSTVAPARDPAPPVVKPRPHQPEVVAIGASTGGPQVLQEILTRLPGEFPLPVLIVQHIAPGFVSSMVDWLRPQCALPVQLANSGQRLDHPAIHIAPTGQHLVVRGRALALTSDPPLGGHRPSATVLFESVAREHRAAAIGVLLTGMGEDGAAGLGDLRRAGAVTIAQDEASSAVFGMPAAAIRLGVVDYVLPPARIAPLIIELAARGRER